MPEIPDRIGSPSSRETQPLQPYTAGEHLPALDGLRGIAILAVMLYHFTLYGGMQSVHRADMLFRNVALAGWVGVDLFFVLSGFLITGILYDSKTSTHFFRNFYSRRFLRIFPLYYGTLFAIFVLLPHIVSPGPELGSVIRQQGWYWSYLVNLLVAVRDWLPFGFIDHFWSLAVEEPFYLVWPVVVFLLDRRKLLLVCVGCMAAALVLRTALVLAGHTTAASVLTPARMDSVAMGAFLALLARSPLAWPQLSRWAPPVLILSSSALLVLILWQQDFSMDNAIVATVGYSLLALFFGAVLSLSIMRPVFTRTLSLPSLRFFGRYSYALYVFHHPLVFFLQRHVISVDMLPRIEGAQLPGQIFFIIVASSLSVMLAVLSWHLYEQHFLKLKRLFPYGDKAIPGTIPAQLQHEAN